MLDTVAVATWVAVQTAVIVDAVRVVAAGGTVEITARERDVLRLLAAGYSNREIGRALLVAGGTLKNHVSSILRKLEVRDRTRAVLKALDRGHL